MFGENIKRIREQKGLGVNELSRLSGVNASYISAMERGEKENPTITTLKKLADTLKVTVDELMKPEPMKEESTNERVKDWSGSIDKMESTEEKIKYLESIVDFADPRDAVEFLLKQPAIMGFGGFNVNEMSDDEIVEFANELLRQLKLISYKYKK